MHAAPPRPHGAWRLRHAPLVVPALMLVLASRSSGQVVEPPPGWYDGDTHGHVNFLNPTVTLPELWIEQQENGLDVLWIQYWNPAQDDPAWYAEFAPLVTGSEEAITAGDPLHAMQAGVEVSGLAASQFGHLQALAIADGAFPNTSSTTPVMAFFHEQPGAVNGYAHVRWPLTYELHPPLALKHFGAVFAPMELTMGLVDFLEVHQLAAEFSMDVRGMYYKLLNTGLRVALSGGSDNTIIHDEVGGSRNYVLLGNEPLDAMTWAAGLKAGRSTVSIGETVFLDLQVEGARLGDQLDLAPGPVDVTATVIVADGVAGSGSVDIVLDGNVIETLPYDLPAGGAFAVDLVVDVQASGWLAAFIDDVALTGAIYLIVDGKPIASEFDAVYWQTIMQTLRDNLRIFATGTETASIEQDLERAVEVFTALAAVDAEPPAGVRRVGVSSQACEGPIAAGVLGMPIEDDPDFAITCLNAPPDALGLLMIGAQSAPQGVPLLGAKGFVFPVVTGLLVTSDGGGYTRLPALLPTGFAGATFYVQFLWSATPECGAASPTGFSASDALEITIQPAGA